MQINYIFSDNVRILSIYTDLVNSAVNNTLICCNDKCDRLKCLFCYSQIFLYIVLFAHKKRSIWPDVQNVNIYIGAIPAVRCNYTQEQTCNDLYCQPWCKFANIAWRLNPCVNVNQMIFMVCSFSPCFSSNSN